RCCAFAKIDDPIASFAIHARVKSDVYDYIVVVSGSGVVPLAANLAREGFRVLLLEAGGDDEPYNYQVPAFHALATEDPLLRWDYFVRHYSDELRQRGGWKYSDVPEA